MKLDSISIQNVCTNLFRKGTIRFIVECSAAGISSATADQEDALETGMPLRMVAAKTEIANKQHPMRRSGGKSHYISYHLCRNFDRSKLSK